jgi:hypothetical protein
VVGPNKPSRLANPATLPHGAGGAVRQHYRTLVAKLGELRGVEVACGRLQLARAIQQKNKVRLAPRIIICAKDKLLTR